MHHDKETNGKETFLGKETWEAKKQKLKEKYPELTDEDLSFEDGNEEGLVERINSKIGSAIDKTKEGIHKFIEAI